MKLSVHRCFCMLSSCVGLSAFASGEPEKKVTRTPSDEEIALARKAALLVNPVKHLEVATGNDPAKAIVPKGILEDSDILCFQGVATLVPKRAILVTPKNYEGYLKFQPGSKFISWTEFFAANRSWITTVEVSRAQAEGNEAMGEATRKTLDTSKSLVVATFQGGPISVLPQKEGIKSHSTKSSK